MKRHLFALSALLWGCVSPCVADENLRRAAATLGFTPTSMAASGLAVTDVAQVFARLRASSELDAVYSAGLALQNAEQAFAAAQRDIDPFDPTGADAIEQAAMARDQAVSSLAGAVNAAIVVGAQDLNAAQRQKLAVWRGAPASLPGEFKVSQWSAAEAKALQEALLEERVAIATEGSVSSEAAAILAQARSRAEVVDAAQRLQTQLEAIKTSYLQATE